MSKLPIGRPGMDSPDLEARVTLPPLDQLEPAPLAMLAVTIEESHGPITIVTRTWGPGVASQCTRCDRKPGESCTGEVSDVCTLVLPGRLIGQDRVDAGCRVAVGCTNSRL
jgi:hypothetical protein